MKSDKQESYDTIGLDDDKIITGATNIMINDGNADNFKSVSGGVDNNKTKNNSFELVIKKDDDTGSSSGGVRLVDKFKSFFKLDNANSDNSNGNKQEIITTNDSESSSCKQKLLKKLQDNIEIEKSYQTFFILLAIGLALICLSLVFLPVIILSPYKFVLCFSVGSLLILGSFIFIYGTKSYFEILFSQNRFPFTLLFLGSIISGITFAWSHYFLLSLLCSVFQLTSLIVFTLSFIPGGRTGISFIGRALTSPFTNMWMRIRGQSYLPA